MRSPPLAPDRALRDLWFELARTFADAELDGLATRSARGVLPEAAERVLSALPRGVPEEGVPLAELLASLGRSATVGLQTNGPGYLAYVPGGGLVASAIASFVSLVLNRFVGLAEASPALARLEHEVLDFLARELGLPETTAGILVSGGSIANLSAIVTARVERFGDSGDLARAVVLTSTEAHRSVLKAARIAGIPSANVRLVAVDRAARMEPAALADAIARARAEGLEPFLVVAAGGTTNTGAIDPLPALADLAADQRLWLHVDAAYGGAFALVPEGRAKLAGIERADSVTLDPHKGLFLPYGVGCLLVRDGAALRRAHAERGAYLQDLASDDVVRSPTDYGPELSRPDRGILLWLPLALHGAAAFRDALAQKLALARELHDALAEDPAIEIAAPLELSIVAFRPARRRGEPLPSWSARAAAWLARIHARERVYLSSTLLPVEDGLAFTLRACVLSFRTDGERIAMAIEDIRGTADPAETTPGA